MKINIELEEYLIYIIENINLLKIITRREERRFVEQNLKIK